MNPFDRLLEHREVCTVCGLNPSGTRLTELRLCPEGEKLKQAGIKECEDKDFVKHFTRFLVLTAFTIGGCVLIGLKLGAEVAIGAFILAVASRFTVVE